MSEQKTTADEYDRRLIAAGYSGVVRLGDIFGPTGTSCDKCGALILLGRPMECNGEQIEKNLHAHALWHARTPDLPTSAEETGA